MSLPDVFLKRPIAHRALHGPGAPENSREAVRRAVAAGYGIEIDLQLSSDAVSMVFHDDALERLTDEVGPVCARDAQALAGIGLTGGNEGIPNLREICAIVGGAVPLLIELKDQSGGSGGSDGALEAATAEVLKAYSGPVAVMSFNPDQVARMAKLLPDVPRGLTTCDFNPEHWPKMPEPVGAYLRGIPDFDRVGGSFVSHDRRDLGSERIAELKGQGVPVLCWTIRSPEEEAEARRVADNVTFEGYLA